ncbi:MAG: hypothetical protein LBK47_10840 [Prevotellaceae bacterium]|nr:hypothetical protein [Prevotellaceae bacterium]
MAKYKILLIILTFLHVNLFSQVVTRRGSIEWIGQQGKIYSKKQAAKYIASKDIVEAKIQKLGTNSDFSEITSVNVDVSIDFFKIGTVEDVNDTLEVRMAATNELTITNAFEVALNSELEIR